MDRTATGRRSRVVALVGCLLLGGSPALGGDDLAARRAQEWRRVSESLLASDRPDRLGESALPALAAQMPSFDADAFEALAGDPSVGQLPDDRRIPAQHALRSLAHLHRYGALLDRGPAICLLLGRADEGAWAQALVELLREPFGERLGLVAEGLSRDRRGPLRAMAGTLVLYLNAFCGGTGSDWGDARPPGWDPTPLVRDVAARLLGDPNPAVACTFATYHAYALEDKTVVDLLVSLLADPRESPEVHAGLLGGAERTVGEACRATLDAHFLFYRRPGFAERFEPPALRRVASLPASGTAEALGTWWRENRDGWTFRPKGPAWRRALDAVVTIPPRGARTVETPFGPLHLSVPMYGEGSREGRPHLSIRVEVHAPDGSFTIDLGNPEHHLGYVGRSTTSGWHEGSIVYAREARTVTRMGFGLYTTRFPR